MNEREYTKQELWAWLKAENRWKAQEEKRRRRQRPLIVFNRQTRRALGLRRIK